MTPPVVVPLVEPLSLSPVELEEPVLELLSLPLLELDVLDDDPDELADPESVPESLALDVDEVDVLDESDVLDVLDALVLVDWVVDVAPSSPLQATRGSARRDARERRAGRLRMGRA